MSQLPGGLPALFSRLKTGDNMSLEQFRAMQKSTGQRRLSDTDRLDAITKDLGALYGDGFLLANGNLRLVFEGATLASLNVLLGAHHMARYRYAKAWHSLVAGAVSRCGATLMKEPVEVEAVRIGPVLLDIDNVNAKAAIDGLRQSGVLQNDTPDKLLRVIYGQEKGAPCVRLTVVPCSL